MTPNPSHEADWLPGAQRPSPIPGPQQVGTALRSASLPSLERVL